MKKIVNVIKYILIFITILVLLLSLLVGTAKIPKSAIESNIKKSVAFYKENDGIEELQKRREYTFLHLYADAVLLNIIYNIDSEKPLESVMTAMIYKEFNSDLNNDFIKLIEEEKEPNQEYMRYWHGSMIIIRPLLTIFNIEQIYTINKIIMWSLAIVLLVLLFRKSKKLAIIYVIAMIMIVFPLVPFCFEYTWMFYIMLISSIIAILIEKKGNKGIFLLFFISGILTCFFDFLTTMLITILVPLLLIIFIRKEENRLDSFKKTLIFVMKSCILWFIAYVFMWIAKWTLASIILNINALEYVKDNAMLRINGLQRLKTAEEMYFGAIYNNWHNLYPINIVKRKSHLVAIFIIPILVIIALFDWKNIKKKWFCGILLLIAIMPYIRYLILANHSYRHAFFTFRTQIITIMALGMIIVDGFNYKLWSKNIELKRKK